MISKTTDIIHMCISIAGALRNRSARQMKGWLDDENGIPMSGTEVRNYFLKAQLEGKRVLPMADCDNFDYQTGCRGHGITLLVHDWEFEEGNG